FKWVLGVFVALTILGSLTVAALYFYWQDDLPSVAELKEVRLQTPMQVYSSDAELIAQFGEIRRIPLKLEEIPQPLINAFLATEDQRFYDHFGIDPIGVAR